MASGLALSCSAAPERNDEAAIKAVTGFNDPGLKELKALLEKPEALGTSGSNRPLAWTIHEEGPY